MGRSFRQSMTWLHTWAGLLVGWVLFFVFLTGTFGYVNAEVDRWMRPEQPSSSAPPSAAELLSLAERYLRSKAPDAELWQITFPGERGSLDLSAGWREPPLAGEVAGPFKREVLDPVSGLPRPRAARETGGGMTLYVMHYALHYLPPLLAYYIVGACTMFMLVAILTGIVAHRKIFQDFFTFRPAKGQRSWLDGHNLLAVTALPFHLMITWSGLVFFLFTYMPVALDALYPKGEPRARFLAEVYGVDRPDRSVVRPSAPLVPLIPLLEQAESRWGRGNVAFMTIASPDRDDALITFFSYESRLAADTRLRLRFDGATGSLLGEGGGRTTAAPEGFNNILLALHEGRFAGPLLRFLYVVSGLAGTAMIGAGLLLWSTKRKAKLKGTDRPHFGIAVVDVLNLGTVIGLPIAIAAYFWANRLLPVEMAGRAAWEVHAMFIAWGASFLYAVVRPLDRAWPELCWMAAALCVLLPALNALTTDRHLGVSMPSGDWVFAGFDLAAIAAGLSFTSIARLMRRRPTAIPVLSAPGRSPVPTATRAARFRWSIVSRVLAATVGGYGVTSLATLAFPLALAALGGDQAPALLGVTTASFLVYAAIVMAIFYARSASRAWAWLAGGAVPLLIIVLVLLPGARS